MIGETIFLTLMIATIVGLSIYYDRQNPLSGDRLSSSVSQNRRLYTHILHQLNCKPVWEKDKEGSVEVCKFDYQSGHFALRLEEGSSFARLSFPFFYVTSVDRLDLVRMLCNQLNITAEALNLNYTLIQEQNQVAVHIMGTLLPSRRNAKRTLVTTLDNVFAYRNAFITQMNQALDKVKKNQDPEQDHAHWARELFLLRQMEMDDQPEGDHPHDDATRHLTLSQLLSRALHIDDFTPIQLQTPAGIIVAGDQDEHLREIYDYWLAAPLLTPDSGETPQHPTDFSRQEASFHLTFTEPRHPQTVRQLSIELTTAGKSTTSLYYRVSLMLIPLSRSKAVSALSDGNQLQALSLLMAYDMTSTSQQKAEFDYMWADAKDKIEQGKEQELTPEQQLIAHVRRPKLASLLYEGKKRYLDGRFYEALPCLQQAYRTLVQLDKDHTEAPQHYAFELCYLLGSCLMQLHRYDEAYYYLELTLPLHNIVYTEQTINCMVSNDDVRAEQFIDQLLSELSGDDADPDAQAHLGSMVGFLHRSKARLLIRHRRYDDAEQLLRQMLDEPDNSDYAIHELAQLQRLKN